MVKYCKDVIQESEGVLTTPEIRVWCHPHKIGKSGDDYYHIFETFAEAEIFIKVHPEAEEAPLIAFAGYEVDLYSLQSKSEVGNV